MGPLHELSREQAGLPTAAEFDAWRRQNGLFLSSAAELRCMTRRMITHYHTGSKPTPKAVGVAQN